MCIALSDLLACLDKELQPGLFRDYCPNGLQVEGRARVTRLVTGVTACQALIDRAVACGADALLVHHGYFWKGEAAVITGMKQRRIRTLLDNGISLLAYHLPLDAHSTLGNNAELARLMDWEVQGGLEEGNPRSIGNWGQVAQAMTLDEMSRHLEQVLGRRPLVVSGGDHRINRVAWCTGAAQSMIESAFNLGVDAFISGEISESTVHFARENGIHYLSAGHHATERYGVQALGRWLEAQLGIAHQFIDIDSPV